MGIRRKDELREVIKLYLVYRGRVMLRRIVLLLIVFSLVTIFNSGCGKKSETVKKTIIKYAVRGGSTDYNTAIVLKREFEKKYPNIEIKLTLITPWGKYGQKILTMAAGGTVPDILTMTEMEYFAWIEKGILLELNQYIQNDDEFQKRIPDVFPVLMDMAKYKNKIYAFPAWFNVVVMFYNKDIFDKEKIPYPDETWDWDKFLEVCKKLTKDINRDGRTDQFGTFVYRGSWIRMFLSQQGIPLFDNKNRCNLDKPEAVQIVKWYYDLVTKHKVAPVPLVESREQGPDLSFMSGRIAMLFSGSYQVRVFKNIRHFSWDIAPLPKGKKRATSASTVLWGISNQCKYPKEAIQVLKYLTSPEGQRIRFKYNADSSILKSVFKETVMNPNEIPDNDHVFLESIDYAIGMTKFPENSRIFTDILGPGFDLAIIGKKSIEESCRDLTVEINKFTPKGD